MTHTVILAILKKKHIFILGELCKRTECPSIETLALLFFVRTYLEIMSAAEGRWGFGKKSTLADKGGRGVRQMLTSADKGGMGGLVNPDITDKNA